jgi:hypothetical protein
MRKPGALAGSVPLDQARASGRSPALTRRCGPAARRASGEPAATRVLVEVPLLHRHMAAADVITGIEAALSRRRACRRRRRGRGPQGRRRPRRRARPETGGEPAAVPQVTSLTLRRPPRCPPIPGRCPPSAPTTSCSRGPAPSRKASHDPRARHHRGSADAAVDTACRVLRLPTLRDQSRRRRRRPSASSSHLPRFLAELLMAECEDRDRRRAERQVRGARVPARNGWGRLRLRR